MTESSLQRQHDLCDGLATATAGDDCAESRGGDLGTVASADVREQLNDRAARYPGHTRRGRYRFAYLPRSNASGADRPAASANCVTRRRISFR